MPSNSARRLDETMATEIESLRSDFNVVSLLCFIAAFLHSIDIASLIIHLQNLSYMAYLLIMFHDYCSLSSMDSMRNVMELLGDMLQAVNPADRKVWPMIFFCILGGRRIVRKLLM